MVDSCLHDWRNEHQLPTVDLPMLNYRLGCQPCPGDNFDRRIDHHDTQWLCLLWQPIMNLKYLLHLWTRVGYRHSKDCCCCCCCSMRLGHLSPIQVAYLVDSIRCHGGGSLNEIYWKKYKEREEKERKNVKYLIKLLSFKTNQ